MSNKKQYIQVSLLTGRSYIGYVTDDFSPNYNDDMSFILFNSHCFYTKLNKNGEPLVELISVEDTPEGFTPDIEIMWQSVSTVLYLKENSSLVKKIENRNKDKKVEDEKPQPNLIVLNNEKKVKGVTE
ncbi:MAG: hypothetical protein HY934_09165 [Candidatus Firestonebacteria bacterium]|nr:hypothetical protein [Candidatus Firestonebacteria bacterium]